MSLSKLDAKGVRQKYSLSYNQGDPVIKTEDSTSSAPHGQKRPTNATRTTRHVNRAAMNAARAAMQ